MGAVKILTQKYMNCREVMRCRYRFPLMFLTGAVLDKLKLTSKQWYSEMSLPNFFFDVADRRICFKYIILLIMQKKKKK